MVDPNAGKTSENEVRWPVMVVGLARSKEKKWGREGQVTDAEGLFMSEYLYTRIDSD